MASGSINSTPSGPFVDPRTVQLPKVGSVSDEYKRQSDDFRNQLPQFAQQLQNNAANQARGQYQDASNQIRSNANSRGLLYSGLKTGAEQDTKAALSGQLANKYADINSGLQNAANQVDEGYVQRLLNQYQGDVATSLAAYNQDMSRRAQQQGLIGGLLGSGLAAGGGALALSDEREKKNKSKADKEVDELLSVIKPQVYEYKDEENGEGKHMSPMAQDLEKSEIGKSMVEDTDDGKVVNYGKGLGAIMAIQGVLNDRLKKLEEAKA